MPDEALIVEVKCSKSGACPSFLMVAVVVALTRLCFTQIIYVETIVSAYIERMGEIVGICLAGKGVGMTGKRILPSAVETLLWLRKGGTIVLRKLSFDVAIPLMLGRGEVVVVVYGDTAGFRVFGYG